MRLSHISLLVITLIFSLGGNVLFAMGIEENRFQAAMVALALIPAYSMLHSWKKNNTFVLLLTYLTLFSIFKLITDRGEGTRAFLLTIISAPIIYASLPYLGRKNKNEYIDFWTYATYILLFAYLAETGVAIYERVAGRQIFGWASYVVTLDAIGIENYRSSALYGHPLYNALMVSISMAFILISDLRPKYKFFLWGLGYAAILCFNARASIVGNALLLGLYLLHTSVANRKVKFSTKIGIILLGIVIAAVAYKAIMSGLVGARLLNMGLMDEDSSQVRIDAVEFVSGLDMKTYLYGMSFNEFASLLRFHHVEALENFWIEYLLRYGLVFLVPYVFFYFLFMRHELQRYSFFESMFVCTAFILIASTNNSLSTSFVALLYFLVLIRIFDPLLLKQTVKRKYLLNYNPSK
jgi:hypothetical protein